MPHRCRCCRWNNDEERRIKVGEFIAPCGPCWQGRAGSSEPFSIVNQSISLHSSALLTTTSSLQSNIKNLIRPPHYLTISHTYRHEHGLPRRSNPTPSLFFPPSHLHTHHNPSDLSSIPRYACMHDTTHAPQSFANLTPTYICLSEISSPVLAFRGSFQECTF